MLASRLPHGLIIEGPTGIGVKTVAQAIASEIGAMSFVIEPKKKVKNEFVVDANDGSVIIEDIRRLYEQTRTKQSEKHVYIIDTGEKSMTLGAQNAFLKLLEEPRPNLHFIIVTHRFDQLLPTIVSRSQRLALQPVTNEQTTTMIGKIGIDDDMKRARLTFVGRGLPALIQRLADDDAQYESRVAIMSDAKTMLGSDTYEKMTIIHRYRDNRANTLTLLDDMNHQLKTVLRSNPDKQLVAGIDRNLEVRERIAAGGNIRLHLATAVI
jgi:DNA polymerase-3 subunit delta'